MVEVVHNSLRAMTIVCSVFFHKLSMGKPVSKKYSVKQISSL